MTTGLTLFPYTTLFRSTLRHCHPWPVQPRPKSMAQHVAHQPQTTGTPPTPRSCHCGHSPPETAGSGDRKSTRLNSSHPSTSYAVFCLKKKNENEQLTYV